MSSGQGGPFVPVANISRVLGRIREIEQMIYPKPRVEPEDASKPTERFEKVLDEAKTTTEMKEAPALSDAEQTQMRTAAGSGKLPKSVDERLALWENAIQSISAKYEVDPDLVRAVMRVESGGNPKAVSSAGAIGLMQLMPATARGLGVDPKDPIRNIEGGVKYLAQLSDKYDGDYVKTLAAYNAGSGRVDSYGGVPPFPETQRYVKNVLALYRRYSKGD